ncbi:hypothetical protein BJ878DRAFT_496510 [Calycina marina]|uniref:Uncharacterized protein n=1 Tax=Calycina marina TaxID=1763456 RepID=A0A9P7Z7A4_9HELO|nr:hypothetical protein BJ878DRAFT_496510 [Calycina marina]
MVRFCSIKGLLVVNTTVALSEGFGYFLGGRLLSSHYDLLSEFVLKVDRSQQVLQYSTVICWLYAPCGACFSGVVRCCSRAPRSSTTGAAFT